MRHWLQAMCALALISMGPVMASAESPATSGIAGLAREGKLRVGLFPPQTVKDPATGRLSSIWVEFARHISDGLGVELVLSEHPSPPKVVECVAARACDIAFIPFDARYAPAVDFSHPFIQFDYTFLVPDGQPVASFADADRDGMRIAVVRHHASTLTLEKLIKRAQLVYADAPDPAFELVRSGQAQIMASTRNALLGLAKRLPGARVLADHYGANLNRVILAKGHPEWVDHIDRVIEQAKTSGFLQQAIERAGPAGVSVAPTGDAKD